MERNIRLLECASGCRNMLFFMPVLMPFYRDQMGLSFADFMIADAFFAATVVLCEVPTGWVSDVWRRKTTLMTGMLCGCAGFAVLAAARDLAAAIAAEVVLGVGMSLVSGTGSALLYDLLLSKGRTQDFVRLEGRRRGTEFYTLALSGIAGGLLYGADHRLPLVMTIAAQVAGMVFTAAVDEPERHRKMPERHPLADMAQTARYALRGHADVALIVLFSAALFAATKIIMWTQQPYYMMLGLSESLYGILMAVGYMLAGTSFRTSHWAERHVSVKGALALAWAVAAGITLLSGAIPGLHGVALLMVGGSCIYGFACPRVDDAINRVTGSERRATVLSAANLLRQLLFIPLSVGVGAVSDRLGIGASLLALTGWLGAAGLCLMLWNGRRNGKRRRG